MNRQPRILAGTALGLLMASAPLGAFSSQANATEMVRHLPVMLAQADCPEGESAENCAAGTTAQPEQPERKNRDRKHKQEQQGEAAPAEQPAGQAAPARKAAPAQAEEAAPAEAEQKPREKKRRKQEQQGGQAPAEQPADQAAPVEEAPAKQRAAPAQTEQAAPAEPEQKPREKKRRKPAEAEQQAPAPEATPTQKPASAEETAPKPEPAPSRKKPAAEQPVNQESGGQNAPAEAEPENGQQPAQAQPSGEEAPILDSQKDQQRPRGERGEKGKNGRKPAEAGTQPAQQAETPAPADQGPPPKDDKAAQQAIQPEQIRPVTQEKGKRVDRAPDEDVRRRPRPNGADVLKEIGDRVIIQFGGQTMVESNERPRMTRGAKDVYYEDLPRGQTRETIVRPNGDRVVTISNRNGDVLQRSLITRDGREHILSYVDQRHYEDVRDWRDPGDDLPPLRLDIPRNRYILDSESVREPEDYYDFLEQPPVERVQRLYSIDEVKRSARVRDIARRVDLDTLNFDFGSSTIAESEVDKLQGVADAMERLLRKNPAETFLIEGHTDAVGSDTANLALSDRRAEAVAEALTNVFDIPPENLTTQGYGERYLKVNTQGPERENRRVAIRRITPLVAPAVSAN